MTGTFIEPIRPGNCHEFRVAFHLGASLDEIQRKALTVTMANPPDLDPDDDLEPLPEEEPTAPRTPGIPEAVEEREEVVMEDLSRSKESLPEFSPQDRRQAKRLEGMDLESDEAAEGLGEKISPRTPKKRSPKDPVPGPEASGEGRSGGELEEDLRREAGITYGNVRSSDFEPTAWESSATKVDGPLLDEEGNVVPRVSLGDCAGSVVEGLKGATKRLNIVEKASVSIFLLVALIGLFVFRSLVHSIPQPEEEVRELLSAVSLPVQGEMVSVTSLDAVWRKPQPGDIVRPGMIVVPEVKVQASGSGHLRILFRSETGRIEGDPFHVKLTGGSGDHTVVCSQGYETAMSLVECQAGRLEPWTVTVYESREFDVPIEEWNTLVRFEMPSKTPDQR